MEEPPAILIIDDSATARATLVRLLKEEEYRVRLAASAADALRQMEQHAPDAILLDVVMPDMDGFDLCRRIKSDERWRHVPIILITALASSDDVVTGLHAGADEFLSKPVHGPVLRARIRSMLRLKFQHDELRETLLLREELSNMVAHDMRSPLAAAALYAHLLLKKAPREDQLQYLDAIESQIRRVNAFVNDMLLLAKTERRQLRPCQAPVDIRKLIQEAYDRHVPLAQAKGADLKLDLEGWQGDHPVLLDASLFDRLLDNLLDNALKYGGTGGEICLALAMPSGFDANRPGARAIVSVSDQGPGIPVEERERIFDKYEIVELRHHGLQQIGLGLAFCKMVAEAHGGHVTAQANSPNGTIFRVEI